MNNELTFQRPAIIEDIRTEIRGIRTPARRKKKYAPELPDFEMARNIFTVCTGNRWLELGWRQPAQKSLFGDFWHQGEICFLFAAANTGKSILALQIADALSRRRTPAPFAKRIKPQKVLYVDFEISTAQFTRRYSGPGGAYKFSDNFIRAEFNPDHSLRPDPADYNDLVFAGIEQKIQLVGASVLIIDNITCLRGGVESAAVALQLMQSLKALKSSLNLSILVLAHTPKRSGHGRPLSADDLHGSKLLINFADSAFTIGASGTQRGLCYLKQIKQRNTEQVYGENNVCLCRIVEQDNFIRFKFEGYSPEYPHLLNVGHLRRLSPGARHRSLAKKVAALCADGLSQRQIAKKLGVSLGLVNRLVWKSEKSESPEEGR